jgi:RNA polymerase II subunit A small phosphatase-like protein
LSAAVQPPGSGPHSLATHVSNHHGGASGSGVGATVVDTATIDERISPDTTTDLQPAQDTAAPMYPAVDSSLLDDMDEEDRLIAQGGIGIPSGPVRSACHPMFHKTDTKSLQDGLPAPLLPPVALEHKGRKCLVLDLDETLLHSSFKVSLRRS